MFKLNFNEDLNDMNLHTVLYNMICNKVDCHIAALLIFCECRSHVKELIIMYPNQYLSTIKENAY